MLTNKIKTNKKINKADVFYYGLFIVYAIIIILVFIYSIKFLAKTINTAFSSPQNTDMEAKYGQLHLDEYAIVAAKLGLAAAPGQSQLPATPVNLPTEMATTSEIIATTSDLALSSEPSTSTELVAVMVPETKPQIAVINSTLTSGLAGELKAQLQTAGFSVPGLNSSQPSEPQTIIKVKDSVNQDGQYFSEIKKIVSSKYDFKIDTLDNVSKYDIEIIIGDK
jgi:hypothetical protein